MALMQQAWSAEADELLDLEYLARSPDAVDDADLLPLSGSVLEHPVVRRTLLSVDEKLYQPVGADFEATAYENLSLLDIEDDTDAGFDRWDY